MRLAGDRDRMADARKLPRILVEPHLVQDLAGLADRRRPAAGPRPPSLRPADETEETPGERIVAQHGVVDVGCFLEQWRQHLLEVVERMRRVCAVLLDRALGARTVADPELTLGIARADEEEVALGRVGRDHGDRFGLRKPGHVVEVAVLPVGVENVSGTHALRRGGEQQDTPAHRLHDARPAPGEKRGVVRRGSHPPLLTRGVPHGTRLASGEDAVVGNAMGWSDIQGSRPRRSPLGDLPAWPRPRLAQMVATSGCNTRRTRVRELG